MTFRCTHCSEEEDISQEGHEANHAWEVAADALTVLFQSWPTQLLVARTPTAVNETHCLRQFSFGPEKELEEVPWILLQYFHFVAARRETRTDRFRAGSPTR